MDQKISAMPVATSINAIDLIPIVQGGANKVVTAGTLSGSSVNLSTAGTFKLTPSYQGDDASDVNLSKSFVILTGAHNLPNGADGQIMIFSTYSGASLVFGGNTYTFPPSATMMVIYSDDIGEWLILSRQGVT